MSFVAPRNQQPTCRPANPHQRHIAGLSFAAPVSQNNHVYSTAHFRFVIAAAPELATPAAATVRCLPRATLAFNLACAGKQAAMPSTHGRIATRWCPVRSIRSRSTSRPSLSSHYNIAHGSARSCAESDRSASARVIPSLCAHPTAGSRAGD